ncbi:MAG: 16S rRNA (cytosine(1402)-N(4))-methyltransferase RsmH [Actinomycetota bacterium]
MSELSHVPVLVELATQLLVPDAGSDRIILDATLGAGGHAERVLRASDRTRVIGIDRDTNAIELATQRLAQFGERVRIVHAAFDELEEVVGATSWGPVDGVLWDLGISSMHVDDPLRGFSFRHEAPLDMRMDPTQALSAYDVVNTYSQQELTRIIREYGEERWAARIAEFIVNRRNKAPLSTTSELVDVIKAAVPQAARRGGPHPARRTFQALRIEVNKELDQLKASLPQACTVTRPGGRLVAISYHSLEDRVVKRFMRDQSSGQTPRLRLINRKPARPSDEEVRENPRSSSALLRAAEVLAAPPSSDGGGPAGSAA